MDGELVRLQPSENLCVEITRRHETAVTWYGRNAYDSLDEGVLAAADMQGFSTRRGDKISNIFKLDVTNGVSTSCLEIVPLDFGGFVVDDLSHLPLVFHMVEGDYWRIATDSDSDEKYRLEHRDDDGGNWKTVVEYDGVAVVDAIPALLEETDILYTTNASARSMSGLIGSTPTDFITEIPDHLPVDVADLVDAQNKRLDWE